MAPRNRKQRIQKSVQKIVQLTKQGVLGQYANQPGGLRRLSTRSLQAAKGKAPTIKTNRAVNEELRRRSTIGKYR